jgi:sugar phosphate isomerase/epimerase
LKNIEEIQMTMFGVSPAFVVSLYGQKFTVPDFCKALPQIKKLGYSAFQPEIFLREKIDEWVSDGAKTVASAAHNAGLKPTQFVAHFMWEYFSTPEMITPQAGLDELKQAVQCVKEFNGCSVLTIPALPLKIEWNKYPAMDSAWAADLQKRLADKLNAYVTIVADAGLLLAFEILPFSVIGGIRRFLDICERIGSPKLGINYDAGHAWACREIVPLLPFELKGRIFGTHLGDNKSTDNVKMAPGKGSIEWKPLLQNLKAAGYQGSFDIEIGCKTEEVLNEYKDGLDYLTTIAGE